MTCKFCEKPSYGDTCGYCINLISLIIEKHAKIRHLGPLSVVGAYFNQLVIFEENVAVKGPANTVVSWDTIDSLTNKAIDHA